MEGEAVSELVKGLAEGSLIRNVRLLTAAAADERLEHLRANVQAAMADTGQDITTVCAVTGLAAGTVRGFLTGRGSSIRNAMLIAMALGVSLADLDCTPQEFRVRLERRRAASNP